MVGCNKCSGFFYSQKALNIHKGRVHANPRVYAPDFVKLGIMKRKLTEEESAKITKEVMDMGLTTSTARVQLAIIKAIDAVN
jgi:hypothetical protein